MLRDSETGLPGDHSEWEPPDPIPNSEVKLLSADASLRSPHAKVGHRQALYTKARQSHDCRAFFFVGFSGDVLLSHAHAEVG